MLQKSGSKQKTKAKMKVEWWGEKGTPQIIAGHQHERKWGAWIASRSSKKSRGSNSGNRKLWGDH